MELIEKFHHHLWNQLRNFNFFCGIHWEISSLSLASNHRLATTAVKQLPPDVIAAAQNNALWNKEEELILANVPAVSKSYAITVHLTL